MWYVYINRSSKEIPFSFENLLALQEKVLKQISPLEESALLFAEMKPTVTLGARQVHDENQSEALVRLRKSLSEQGVDVVSGERGGKETWHGPGQWVGFVLSPIQKFTGDSKGVRKAVYLILETVLKVVQEVEPKARIEDGLRLGIWSERGKLVSVGIKIKNSYITSGFALNCIPRPESFYGIHPCGLEGAVPDFLFLDRISVDRWNDEFEKIIKKLQLSFETRFHF